MTDDLERRLEQMGSTSAPDPDASFVARLERRLERGAPVAEGRESPIKARRLLVAGVVAVAIVVVGVALAMQQTDHTAQIASATGAEVVLPDGSVVAASPGQKLPDGAVIKTGPSGSIKAGGTDLGPDAAGVVRGGKVVPTSLSPTTPPPQKRDTTPSTQKSPTRPTSTSRPSDTKPAPMRIDVRRVDGGVAIAWSAYDGRAFDRYVVLRRDDGEPAFGDPATRVVAEIRDRTVTRTLDRAPVPSTLYRVVAVDAEGRVVAATPVAKISA